MYAPQNNSPHTALAAGITNSATTISVVSGSVLPDAPNVLTIGVGEDAELVLMSAKSGNSLTVTRGYNGTTAKAWDSGEWIYRGITAQDISALQNNLAEEKLHVHGNISNGGAIGAVADLPVFTGMGGALETKTPASALMVLGAAPVLESIDTSKTTSFTVDTAAIGKTFLLTNTSDLTVTLPEGGTLPIGFGFYLRAVGTGKVTIAPGTANILLNGDNDSIDMLEDYAATAVVVKISSNSWAVNGEIEGRASITNSGNALVAETAADMTDTSKVYVYVGNEAGYSFGYWYYYKNSDWNAGGQYIAQPPQTDKTLTVENTPADARATGAAVTRLENALAAEKALSYGAYVTEAASGSTASFSDGADGIPLASLTAAIEPVQSGSGDPSPSNVRPITGWTEANIISSATGVAQDGTTYTIDFADAGTVYRGSLNVLTGVLTVPYAGVDLGSLTWQYTTNGYFQAGHAGIQRLPNAQTMPDIICSIFRAATPANVIGGGSSNDNTVSLGVSNSQVFIRDSSYTDAAAFKTAMSGQMLVYPLATPLTYQLTPAQVKSLYGTNNIWADTGNVNLIYRADTKLYIDKMIGA